MSTPRPSLYVGHRGMIVAWHGSLGPAVARFDAWSREAPRFARALGHAGQDRRATPALWVKSDALVVAWCEVDGAWLTSIDLESGEAGPPALAIQGARSVVMGSGRDGATLFGDDADGIVAVELDRSGRPGHPVRAVSQRGGRTLMHAARMAGEGALVYAFPGAEGWGAVATTEDGPIAVKHAGGAYESLHVEAIGGRAACVLERDGGVIHFGLLGPGGKVVERPHPVFDVSAPRLSSPQVVWTDDDWAVLARETESGILRVLPLSERLDPFTLPQCTATFSSAYYGRHLYAVDLEATANGGALRVVRCRRDGSLPQRHEAALVLDHHAVRRVAIAARSTLGGLADRLERAQGYRDASARAELSRDGATLRVIDERGRVGVQVTPREGAIRMRVTSSFGDDPRLPEVPSSLVRLARWVRLRLSEAARSAVEDERRWAATLAAAIGAALHEVHRAGGTLLLELTVAELPNADALYGWLLRVRDEHATRTTRP